MPSFAPGLGGGHKLDEETLASGICDGGEILAIERRLHRVHHHEGAAVVDPEVVIMAITQRLECLERRLLGLRFIKLPGLNPLGVAGHQAPGRLDLMAGLLALLRHQTAIVQGGRKQGQQDE